jgi:hypothetical protein
MDQRRRSTRWASQSSLWPIILGGLVGAAVTQLLTWIREHRRNRDAYRAPQRDSIGAIIAAANTMKVCLSDTLEHLGFTGRSSINVASNKSEKPKQQSRRRRRDRRGPADSESGQPGGGSPTNFVESTRVAADFASDATEHEAEVMGASQRRRIRTERIKGEQLTPQHIGRFVGQAMGSYNVQGRIVDLIPIGTDPDGSWLMTVHWAALPGQPARWAGTACVSATTSSSSTYYRTRQTRPLTRTHPTSPDLEGSDSPKKARRQCATEAESRQRYAPYTPRGSPARYQACC